MDVNEPFSIALMWFTGWHLVTMWQHPSPLSLAKPRQYLESYNRKAYVRPPTAWATAKKTGKCWKISATQFCLKMFEDVWRLCLILVIFVSNNERLGDVWTHPLIPTLDWPNAKIAAFASSWDTSCRPRGSPVCPKWGNCAEIPQMATWIGRMIIHYGILMNCAVQMGTVFSVTPIYMQYNSNDQNLGAAMLVLCVRAAMFGCLRSHVGCCSSRHGSFHSRDTFQSWMVDGKSQSKMGDSGAISIYNWGILGIQYSIIFYIIYNH